MDVDFDSPVNIERPPAPLSFSPDSHEPALHSSPPPSTMPLLPLDPINHQHNSQQQLSQQLSQLPQVPQPDGASAQTTTPADTTAPDRPALSNDTEPTPQLDSASSGETNPPAEAPVDDIIMDTTPDNGTTANRPNDNPVDANPDSSQQTSTSDSQPLPSTDNPPTENTAVSDSWERPVPLPAEPDQPRTGSEAPHLPPANQDQAVAGNAEVDDDDQDDSSSDVSDDQGNDKPQEEHAYWADIEEDTSTPDEEELKEMENAEHQYNAHEYDHWEKSFFPDVDDPEYQPSQKARITWKFKGIRGTKENPNRATIIRSPAAYIGGYYWNIKFFPRGNSVSALSVYIECSRTPPAPVPELAELEFKVLQGAPDAVLSDQAPDVHILPTTDENSSSPQSDSNQPEPENQDQPKQDETPSSPSVPVVESAETSSAEASDNEGNWRVSAQIGVAVYNPNEPRTAWMQSSAHQFNPHNVDWGWTNFHGPWDEIHKRQRGQHQALLRNDTLAFDAHIKIFEDPTQSLWWHTSDAEPAWNSYAITGYAPIGSSYLNHRAEVAALISWCHLAPFREAIQNIDVFANMTDSKFRPRFLTFNLMELVSSLQTERRANGIVDPDIVIGKLQEQSELSGNVIDFWERLRRSLEIEMGEDTSVSQKLSKIFDSQKVTDDSENSVNYLPLDSNSTIRVQAKNAESVQSAVSKYLEQKPGKWSLPEVLTVELNRHEFDKQARRWTVNFDRITLSEELALEKSVVDGLHGGYSLYGFVVHNGKRTSGEFYSILRPGGPGSKWLAFDDGNPFKVECLTSKTALQSYRGLDQGSAKDPNDTYDVAVIVMYVRNDVLKQYLGLELRPIDLPAYRIYAMAHNVLSMMAEDEVQRQRDDKSNIAVEVYSSANLDSLHSLFDGYDLMSCARSNGTVRRLSIPGGTTYNDLREKIALWESPDSRVKTERIRLWHICRAPKHGWLYEENLRNINLRSRIMVIYPGSIIRLWMDIVSEDEAHLFSVPSRDESSDIFVHQPEEVPPPPAPVQVSETEVETETNGEQSSSGNNETDPPERSETPRASDNEPRPAADVDVPMEDGEGAEVVPSDDIATDATPGEVDAQAAEPTEPAELATEPTAANPAPEEQQENDDVAMQDAVDNDAAIAAVIANDLEEFESSQAMEAEPTPPPEMPVVPVPEPLSVPQNSEPTPPQVEEPMPEAPGDQGNATPNPEDSVMDQTDDFSHAYRPADEVEGEAQGGSSREDVVDPPEPPKPELHVKHIHFFLQIFDANKQELRFVGSYFAKENDIVKETLSRVLKWPGDKDFSVWGRFKRYMRSVDLSLEMYRACSNGSSSCFVVEEKLSKAESSKLEEAGLLSKPLALVKYLWASSRKQPANAFTGTKVIDDPITGDHYSGELVKGYYHGKGTHISDGGLVYTGDFILGRRQGQGLMEYPSGDTYSGDWLDDHRHGQGTFIERRTGNKYVGGYRDGKRHGKGISYWEVADEEMDLCQICYCEDQDALFYDCGHVCACVTCAKQVDICPMCRKNVINVVRIFKT